MAYSLLFIAVYSIHLWNYTNNASTDHELQYFDNHRFVTNNFVKFAICIPKTVVDYRFSRVNDAIKQMRVRYRHVHFVTDCQKGKNMLKDKTVDLFVEFTKLIETGKDIKYSINSREGILKSDFCTNCDSLRKEVWGMAIEVQMIVNNFIAIIVTRKTDAVLYMSHFEDFNFDATFLKTQNDLFYTWLMLLPWCARCINLWYDDRKSGLYRNLLNLKVNRIEYILSKFVVWYLIMIIPTILLWTISYILVPSSFVIQSFQFAFVYIGCIVMFCMFLGTFFDRSVFFAKLVGFFLMCAGQFGMGNVYYGAIFFQTAVRFVGPTYKAKHSNTIEVDIGEAVSIACILLNFLIMLGLTIYLDYYNNWHLPGGLPFYYPISKKFWSTKLRPPHNDPFLEVQQVHDKLKTLEVTSPPLITITGICKRVQKCWKVNAVNFVIKFGEVTTLYGHIGCGSKEILEMLHGETHPEFGYISEEAERKLLTAKATCVPNINYMTVKTYLKFIGSIRGGALKKEELHQMMEDLDLLKVENRDLDLLTCTQKERLRIAATFSGQSDLVLINRPTRDTFNDSKDMIIRFIESQKTHRAIVIASYDSEEAEQLSNELVMMSEGYVVLTGNIHLFTKSISSVFEIRLWPSKIFTSAQITDLKKIISCDDERLKRDLQVFETPNGKLRCTLPILYRKSIPLILKQISIEGDNLDVQHYELSTPTLHDIYVNACFDPKQYAPLATYDKLKKFYKAQTPISPTLNFLKILMKIFIDFRFLYEAAIVLLFFGLLVTLVVFGLTEDPDSRTATTSYNSLDQQQHLFCDGLDCKDPKLSNVEYRHHKRQSDQINKNTAGVNIKDHKINAYSFGDEQFIMSTQNYILERFIHMTTGYTPSIESSLEHYEIYDIKDIQGFSPLFPNISAQHAAVIMADSHILLYIMTLAQVFVYIFSTLLPLRLVRLRLSLDNQIFVWPRWQYFLLIFLANLIIFILLSFGIVGILAACGFFPYDTLMSVLLVEAMWICVFITTMPLVYFLVFTVSSATAIVPSVLAIPFICVSLPNLIMSYSSENSISIDTLLSMITSLLLFSPPTTLQFLAAFLNAKRVEKEFDNVFFYLIILCCVHLWIFPVFIYSIIRPDIKELMQCWFVNKVRVTAPFDRRATLKTTKQIQKSDEKQGSQQPQQHQNVGAEDEPVHANDVEGGARKLAGNEAEKDEMYFNSEITKYEEDLIIEIAQMKNWTDQQSIEVGENATFVVGDQGKMISKLLHTVSEMNDDNQITFLPREIHLPPLFSPRQLLRLSASCQGTTVDEAHIDYLLDLFSIEKDKKVCYLDDSDRRIVLLLSKIIKKPTVIIMDQTDLYLPYSKLMTLWALCSRMRDDGLAVMFSSPNHLWAEHMATSVVHTSKCQFLTVLPPHEMKRKISHMLLEVEVRDEKKTQIIASAIKFALKDSNYFRPPTKHRFILELPSDDIDTIENVIGVVKVHTKAISRYNLKMATIADYLNLARV
ncbi:unnamed protein product [Caenorhabditis angaria]|uniref:ABC transporter domain-containing protein n=1 Tax=Caenorhabditis angaria TaxID=860376 RepID=A0A9P1ILU1_9PELO|nr:unnamed protein product [Caenorhabditis angaria]